MIVDFNGFEAYALEVKNDILEIELQIPYSEYEIDNIALGEYHEFKNKISQTDVYRKARKEGLGVLYIKHYNSN